MELNFYPQEIFAPAYYTDPVEIIKNRTVFRKEYTNFVDYGGRGGGKTVDKIKAFVIESTLRPVRILVTRELMNSIKESSKAEIEAAIDDLGLTWFFKITETYIEGLNGSYFMFKGLKTNINNIKSISDVDMVMVEEAENVSKVCWDKLLPSLRPKSGRVIVAVMFNPADELDDTYQRWIENTPSRTLLTKVNWSDNIHFPAFLNELRLDQKRTLPKRDYDHIWEGVPIGSSPDVIIDSAWIKASRFASRHAEWIKAGDKRVGYDPAGQGRDYHAVCARDGNIVTAIEQWALSDDLRVATYKALDIAVDCGCDVFNYDECGGFGDGIAVFVKDAKKENRTRYGFKVDPFNAGEAVIKPKQKIDNTDKTWGEMYSNAKAQVQAITAQQLYNTYRFIKLGDRDISPSDMLSIDIDDDDLFKKLVIELSTPIWVKSGTNSKRKVESKKDMEKRTGRPSPNMADAIHMTNKPKSNSGAILSRR